MDGSSAFMDKDNPPDTDALRSCLAENYRAWEQLRLYVLQCYPKGREEWSFPAKKYGWNFRIKDNKRAIVYLLPREGYFKAAFNFGQRAVDAVMASGVSTSIKQELAAARVYAEGRGIRIDVREASDLDDVMTLVGIKLQY